MDMTYMIQLDNGSKYLARAQDNLSLRPNDWVVIRKNFYQDYGQILQCKGELSPKVNLKEFPKIIRKATVHDKSVAHENEMRAKSAFRTAQKHVDHLKLSMKLLNAHYSIDGKLITIQFTADGRIDFRELVKELSQALNTRIELRQIGVRDETAICGGIGICGQELCCHRFLKEFYSINVRMAKDQDLSLTPSTISGVCGRLKCCLKYEHDGYLELEKTMPRRGDMCECPGGRGKICDRNLLTQEVTVHLEDGGNYLHCDRKEVRVVYPEKYKISRKAAIEPELDENDEEIKKLED
jgi:cell fate regulator YaaT (PSP1 superfamily)